MAYSHPHLVPRPSVPFPSDLLQDFDVSRKAIFTPTTVAPSSRRSSSSSPTPPQESSESSAHLQGPGHGHDRHRAGLGMTNGVDQVFFFFFFLNDAGVNISRKRDPPYTSDRLVLTLPSLFRAAWGQRLSPGSRRRRRRRPWRGSAAASPCAVAALDPIWGDWRSATPGSEFNGAGRNGAALVCGW